MGDDCVGKSRFGLRLQRLPEWLRVVITVGVIVARAHTPAAAVRVVRRQQRHVLFALVRRVDEREQVDRHGEHGRVGWIQREELVQRLDERAADEALDSQCGLQVALALQQRDHFVGHHVRERVL